MSASADGLLRKQRKELVRWIIGTGAPFECASGYRMAEVDFRWIVDVRPVRDDRAFDDPPDVIALLVFVELAATDDDVDIPLACTECVRRDGVDLALGEVAVDDEVHRGGVVLNRSAHLQT